MAETSPDSLLQSLISKTDATGADAWAALAATEPKAVAVAPKSANRQPEADQKLDELLGRVKRMVAPATNEAAAPPGEYLPLEPASLREAGVNDGLAEALVMKFLLASGTASGRDVAAQIRLPFKIVEEVLRQLKTDQLVVYRDTAPMNDYLYQLTDLGRERGRRYADHCTYFGSAPVALEDYVASVRAQSLTRQRPTKEDLERAFADLLLSPRMFARLGPAINSGRGMFLYGAPGNGKSSIAERITRAFGSHIWIPRAIIVEGEILRLFDPSNHEEVPLEKADGLIDNRQIDKRWVRIKRPTIIVGGELTMASLEVTLNAGTNICESPLQLKSNCGTLVIDDFGRQRMTTDELLNRWIVPLEKRYDFLNLPNGKKIEVPFDQLVVFSTNLEPKDLCDDAFLRRIPYKIDVIDPTESEFRQLFRVLAPKLGFEFNGDAVDYLIRTHYVGRPFRCCQPRDLLLQIKNLCDFQGETPLMSPENFDFAVENYFAVM
ncbi:MAG TPA: AAA family ATPase [Pirellulales bacterium]|nr:AAA family ATPase [Pirellulales bacterium]